MEQATDHFASTEQSLDQTPIRSDHLCHGIIAKPDEGEGYAAGCAVGEEEQAVEP